MSQTKVGENLLMKIRVTTWRREEMEVNANLNGKTTEQSSKKGESYIAQHEVKKPSPEKKKVCECHI